MSEQYKKLTHEDKHSARMIAKIASILLRIASVLCWIAVPIISVIIVIAGILLANLHIDTTHQTISFFGESINYNFVGNGMEIITADGEGTIVDLNQEDIEALRYYILNNLYPL